MPQPGVAVAPGAPASSRSSGGRTHSAFSGAATSRRQAIEVSPSRWCRFLLLGVASASWAIASAAADRIGPTVIPRVDDFIHAPHALYGRTRDAIERALGPPQTVARRSAPTMRDPTVARTFDELGYPGLAVRVDASGMVRYVRLTTREPRLPLGLDIGSPRSRVEEVLGEPQELTDERYLYVYSDGFPNSVEFYFRDSRVDRIEWNYWIE